MRRTPHRPAIRVLGSVLGLLLVLALLGPDLPLDSPTTRVGPPFAAPSAQHLLGTDVLGRDTLARVASGGRTLVLQCLGATALGSVVGLLVGTATGLHRGQVAGLGMRVVDGLSALPPLLVLLLLASGAEGVDAVVLVAITVVSLPFSVRVLRAATHRLAEAPYLRAAQARGDGHWRVVRHDVLPNIAHEAWAEAGVRFVAATQLAATAGFLGLGAAAPAANWGRMVRENAAGLALSPWPVLVPAVLVVALALGASLLADRASSRVELAGGVAR